MKEAIKNNKKKIIIGIVLILILLIGLAFAYLTTTLHGEKEYIVRAGSLGLRLEEANELTLEKVIPIEDSEGMKLEGFNFSLINEGNIDTDYTIYLDDIELSSGETRMPDSAIRYSLTKNSVVGNADNLTNMGENPNRRVDFGTIEVGETINYTLKIWIDYDATTSEASGKTFKGKLRVKVSQARSTVSETLLANIPLENQYNDGIDTFITGSDPNNYIWYSGKLWRAVSVNNSAKTTKLVTQWNISAINYSSGDTAFSSSYIEEWLNDTTEDGFLGNLRDYENFIVTDSEWDATLDATALGSIIRPNGTTTVTDAVGLLNIYEYQSSSGENASSYTNSYLNNGLHFWTLTPYSTSDVRYVDRTGSAASVSPLNAYGVRPSINLKSSVKVVDGSGTEDDPYRLAGDNDTNLSGTLLNTRYSGEYLTFGNDENNLYRIVSHENGMGTKIVSAEPLKSSGTFITSAFDSNSSINYSTSTSIGTFLNGDYLTNYVDSSYANIIEDSTTWYLGIVGDGSSYKLAKYTDTNMSSLTSATTDAKVGLLRYGELMAGQFDISGNNTHYWLLTPYSTSYMRRIHYSGQVGSVNPTIIYGIRPSLNLKSNVIITGGTGTKENPFTIELGS